MTTLDARWKEFRSPPDQEFGGADAHFDPRFDRDTDPEARIDRQADGGTSRKPSSETSNVTQLPNTGSGSQTSSFDGLLATLLLLGVAGLTVLMARKLATRRAM
jgi:hypothetical protein